MALVQARDLPGVDEEEFFWTDEFVENLRAWTVNDRASALDFAVVGPTAPELETVCVTTPTN
jgi:hypothetical protein